jgi:sensor c-di-GMP phosphodiesterase-like protein
MAGTLKKRVLIGQAAAIALTACGLVTGYLLGCGFSLQLAEGWLDQTSKLMASQNDASFLDARNLLATVKDSPYPYCSEAEIAWFRNLVFRSEFLKDAGRMRGGRIECSATMGHPQHPIGNFKPNSHQGDGIVGYSNLVPTKDTDMRRPGLQLGSAYVVLGSSLPSSLGPIPMHLTVRLKDDDDRQVLAQVADGKNAAKANLTTDGSLRLGETLYRTRCSAVNLDCVTASTSVSEAFGGEAAMIAACTFGGGVLGLLGGMAVSFAYRRNRDRCQQLRRAVERDKLTVVYQPIVDLSTRRIVGAEALARWTDEEGSEVEPDDFIKIAEDHGFISEITELVLRRSLRAFAEILRNRPSLRLSVNVAAADLCDPKFLPMLDELLRSHKIHPKSLAIEITERSTGTSDIAMETIRNLRRMGCSVHIDDFGTGYSNLDKLLYLFADTIKIDKAFTRLIGSESVTVAILPQILAMAKSLNLEVVVEGVELERQADYFSQEGLVTYGQGWLFGRPTTAEEFQLLVGVDSSVPMIVPNFKPSRGVKAAAAGLHIMDRTVA